MDQTSAKRPIIVIKMPDPLLERIMAFPTIHLIRDTYPEADMHFICSENKIELLYTLPFEGFYHPWKDEEIKSVLDVHRYVTFLKIGDVDIFFCLGSSLSDISLGWFLSAKKRVAFAEGIKKWFTTYSVARPTGHHMSEEFLYLYKEFTNRRIPENFKIRSREMQPYSTSPEQPYVAIDLWPFSPGKIDDFWKEYMSFCFDKKFVLFFSDEASKGALLIERFMEKLPSQNKYEFLVNTNLIEQGKMLSQAKGVITRNLFTASYATYLGTDTLLIYENGEPRRDAPIPFFANWRIMDVRNPSSAELVKKKSYISAEEILELTKAMFYF